MKDWPQIRPIVEEILSKASYSNSGRYTGERCFLTAYQIAVLVNNINPTLKGTLPVGGEGVGPDSFSRQIAWHLSKDITNGFYNDRLELQFLSLNGLEGFIFDAGHRPSLNEFSMFRLLEQE